MDFSGKFDQIQKRIMDARKILETQERQIERLAKNHSMYEGSMELLALLKEQAKSGKDGIDYGRDQLYAFFNNSDGYESQEAVSQTVVVWIHNKNLDV